MTIYGRTGDVVTVIRRGKLDDVQKLEGRKPDKKDREAVKNDGFVVVRHEDGKEALYHLAFLRADGGSLEISEALAKAEIAATFDPKASDCRKDL